MSEIVYASATDFTQGSLADLAEPFTLPSGRTVKVRGLSRHELLKNGKDADGDTGTIEIFNVMSCVVLPQFTRAQVEAWQRRDLAGGDFQALSQKIRELSGLGEGADKSDVPAAGE
jgi:hypothetical protein